MKGLILDGESLSKSEMNKIIGGNASASPCVSPGTECYVSGTIRYTCSYIGNEETIEDCCCGHDAGNHLCWAV